MTIEIRDEREERGRYAAYLDGQRLGHATWVKVHDTVVLPHTEVELEWEGRGIGSLLARRAFDDARADGLTVLPFCPFMKRWAELHPDYRDVVRTPRPGELPSIESAVHAAQTLELLAKSSDEATTATHTTPTTPTIPTTSTALVTPAAPAASATLTTPAPSATSTDPATSAIPDAVPVPSPTPDVPTSPANP